MAGFCWNGQPFFFDSCQMTLLYKSLAVVVIKDLLHGQNHRHTHTRTGTEHIFNLLCRQVDLILMYKTTMNCSFLYAEMYGLETGFLNSFNPSITCISEFKRLFNVFFLCVCVCVYSCVHWPILALKPVPYLTGVYKSVNIRMMPTVSNAGKCMSSTDFICVLPSSRSSMKKKNQYCIAKNRQRCWSTTYVVVIIVKYLI